MWKGKNGMKTSSQDTDRIHNPLLFYCKIMSFFSLTN